MTHPVRVERLVRACRSGEDARSVRLAVLDELTALVGYDAYAWLLTDPDTQVGASPLADVPCLGELPRLIRLKYLTDLNRWTGLGAPVALLRAATGDRRERSLVWRDLQRGYDVGDVASMVFRDRFGTWAFLDLWRIGRDAAFSADDASVLARVAPAITEALRRCQARTFDVPAAAMERAGPVVLVLTADLAVAAQTAETEGYLRQLVPPDGDRPPVPAGAYNVGAQLLAVEAGVDAHAPTARVHLSGGTWLTLRAARIGGPPTPGTGERAIAVTIEPASPEERTSLYARACGLSDRERELVGHLATGADTREVASRMFLAESTVQDHLKSIFAKTGTNNRRLLLARATGR